LDFCGVNTEGCSWGKVDADEGSGKKGGELSSLSAKKACLTLLRTFAPYEWSAVDFAFMPSATGRP
jgi:hypothetical protein